MAVSKNQPMRQAEQQLVDQFNTAQSNLNTVMSNQETDEQNISTLQTQVSNHGGRLTTVEGKVNNLVDGLVVTDGYVNTLISAVNALPKMERGSIDIASVAVESSETGTIAFDSTYSAVPQLLTNISNIHANTRFVITGLNTAGFQYAVYNDSQDTALTDIIIDWIALSDRTPIE